MAAYLNNANEKKWADFLNTKNTKSVQLDDDCLDVREEKEAHVSDLVNWQLSD